MIAELKGYAFQNPPPLDSVNVKATVHYLEACNQLFERGILSCNGWIKTYPNPITDSIMKGYGFLSMVC